MNSLNEITVFTLGDARELKTWSNVPYFFTNGLEQKGIKINRVDIEENQVLDRIYKYTAFAVLKTFYPNSNHTFFRTQLNYFLTQRKIKKAIASHPSAQMLVFMSFSFNPAKYCSKPVVLFGDWTYLYYIRNFLQREPYWFEQGALKREKQDIAPAQLVLGLFPLSAVFIKANYNNRNCHYLGNVINANHPLNIEEIFKRKLNSRKILFIGNKKYLDGAMELITAFSHIKNSDAELHLVGLTEGETKCVQAGIFHHGYLDKGDEAQNELYYRLIYEARVIVNTTGGWGAFSAMTEAMYYYTPVITTRYEEFTETYGREIGFGIYIDSHPGNALREAIAKMLCCNEAEQKQQMEQAHEAVKDFTWSNYTNKVLQLIGN